MIAKAMNARLGRWENFWATEQPNAVYLVEAADRFAKLVYLLANPVADHSGGPHQRLARGRLAPLNLSGSRDDGEATSRLLPSERQHARGGCPSIERPDGFEALSDAEWRVKLQTALRVEEERAREERRASRRGVLGRKAVLRAAPTDRPNTVEPRRGLRPYVACRNESRRVHELLALLAFRLERNDALLRSLAGERDVAFPLGTYRIRGFFGPPIRPAMTPAA